VTHAVTANGKIESATLAYRDAHTIARLDRSASPFTDYRGIPANQLGSGLNRFVVLGTVTATSLQEVIRYFKTPVDQAITLPPALPAITPTATSTPYPSGAATFAVQAGVSLYDLEFSTTNQTTSHDWFAEITAAYAAKAFPGGTIAYTMPDFHALPGWQAAFQLEAGQPIDWSIGETTSVNIQLFNTVPPGQFGYHDGGEEQIAGVNGQLAAP
jgi:hypothetical protein